ncbi:MAG: AAA family ATPase [Tissierellia bacterium]|nr:AAA family ATPase [Tissierellia bacterium]
MSLYHGNLDLREILKYIDPAHLNYQEWVNVGMALKEEGYTAADWDEWSQGDIRYKAGECFRKWTGFLGTGTPVTGGTIVAYAKEQGWSPIVAKGEGHELEWDDEIQNDLVVIDSNWLEGKEIEEPKNWNPVKELAKYIETLFESTENVGYVTETWKKDDKFMPTKGSWDRTAGELIEALNKCNGDIGSVIGDYNEEAGAWIRFNPLDGKGVKNENVTDFRYALVESDTTEIDKQNAIIRELELPVACMVFSGKKSVHAIVKIDAGSYEEYRKRVDYLYNVCQKNGLKIDSQNRNPSRLSRMPGIVRDGRKQFLIDTNIGKENWTEWFEWIEGVNDDLPDPESLADSWDNLPELSPPLIQGVLRQGHKMLLAGPSKAGKSYALIELCIAIAEGKKWFNWDCSKGRVLYVNLELDSASCLHRFKDVYEAQNIKPENLSNIDIWNLRGKSVPMDKLAPKLIRRAQKKGYIAVVIDPIYKVITGDENSADQMAHFTNQFDKVCTELGSAVIYCHHHSKGYQGSKRSMDRASGSGVFARDPDALLDLMELEVKEETRQHEENKAVAKYIAHVIKNEKQEYYLEEIGLDDLLSKSVMMDHAKQVFTIKRMKALNIEIEKIEEQIKHVSAWRIEGTLREFASFEAINLWFKYPIHELDESDILKDLEPESEKPSWQKAIEKRKSPEQKKEERIAGIEVAFEACNMDSEGVTTSDLAEYMGVSNRTVWSRIKEHGGFETIKTDGKSSIVIRKDEKS